MITPYSKFKTKEDIIEQLETNKEFVYSICDNVIYIMKSPLPTIRNLFGIASLLIKMLQMMIIFCVIVLLFVMDQMAIIIGVV